MSLFPINPTVGTEAEVAGSTFEWDGVKWIKTESSIGGGGGTASIVSGDTPPADAQSGDVWFNTENLELYVYYFDGDESHWIQATSDSVLISNIANDILPATDRQYNIGAAETRWATGYFNQLFVGTNEISNTTSSAAAGVINTSEDLPDDAPIGQLYVITQEQAVKVWLGSSWVNLIDGAIPIINTVNTQTGNPFNGESDVIFVVTGSNFVNNDAGTPSVKVETQDGTILTANYVQFVSTEELRFSFFREFTVEEGPLKLIVENPNGLAASKISAIQTGSAPQWIGPTRLFSALTESELFISIRSASYISDDNAIDGFTFKVYTDITYTTENPDRLIAPGITLSEEGLIEGTTPAVTSESTYTFFIGVVDGVGNETKVELNFVVIASAALPTASSSFIPSNRPSTSSSYGTTLNDWSVVQSPMQNSTMSSMMNYYSTNGSFTPGGQATVSLQREGDTGWFNNKVCRFFSQDANGTNAIIAFEDPSVAAAYDTNSGAIGMSGRPASDFNGARSVVIWGYNSSQGWLPLWHAITNTGYVDLTSSLTLRDGGTTQHSGWYGSGYRGYYQRRKVVSTTSAQDRTIRTESTPPSSNTGIVGYGASNGFKQFKSPSNINKNYFTSARFVVYGAAGNLAASNEYIYVYTYGTSGSGNGDSASISTGQNSGNMLPVNYRYDIPDLMDNSVYTQKFFYMLWNSSSGITFSPSNILSSSISSSNNLVNRYHFGFWYYIDWSYTIPGSTSTTYVNEYATTYGLGKQAAYDTMPLEYIGFATYT